MVKPLHRWTNGLFINLVTLLSSKSDFCSVSSTGHQSPVTAGFWSGTRDSRPEAWTGMPAQGRAAWDHLWSIFCIFSSDCPSCKCQWTAFLNFISWCKTPAVSEVLSYLIAFFTYCYDEIWVCLVRFCVCVHRASDWTFAPYCIS